MNYQKILQQIQDGSVVQRKRKQQLDKEKKKVLHKKKQGQKREYVQKLDEITHAQLLYCKKIQEGNRNSRRTLNIRLFFSHFQKKEIFEQLKSVEELMPEFDRWLIQYQNSIQTKNWEEEKRCNTMLILLLKNYERKKKEIEHTIKKEKEKKNIATLMLAQIILTTTILLFKETKNIEYNKDIFGNHRYNPLNPFFPLNFNVH